MLRLHFINVGDGDAVLAEEERGGETFRLLADAGRADVGSHPGSRRLTAARPRPERRRNRCPPLQAVHKAPHGFFLRARPGDPAGAGDILKAPHHGDAKSLTPLLVRRLRPEHAVISCSAEYVARKDRPSLAAIRLLEEQGARVWFTDSFPQPGREPSCWSSADFTIREDGAILPPDRG